MDLDYLRWAPDGDPQVAAEAYFGSAAKAEKSTNNTPGEKLVFVDLRKAKKNSEGYSLYDGQQIDPTVVFLAIDPAQLNWDDNLGYKGIRADKYERFGREQHTERFPETQETTSRAHFSVMFDSSQNQLIFTDNSTNGTTISSRTLEELPTEVTLEYNHPEMRRKEKRRQSKERTLGEGARIISFQDATAKADQKRFYDTVRQPSKYILSSHTQRRNS